MASSSGWSLNEIIRLFQQDFVPGVTAGIAAQSVITEMEALPPSKIGLNLLRDPGSSSPDMNVDGSGVTRVSEWEVPPGPAAKVGRLTFFILDKNIRPDRFGGLPALTNGCLMEVIGTNGAAMLLDLCDGLPIIRHQQFGLISGVDVFTTTEPSGDDAVLIGFSLLRVGGPLRLLPGQRIRFTVRDDLTGLTVFQGMVEATFE